VSGDSSAGVPPAEALRALARLAYALADALGRLEDLQTGIDVLDVRTERILTLLGEPPGEDEPRQGEPRIGGQEIGVPSWVNKERR
jgi:hypothetical protein